MVHGFVKQSGGHIRIYSEQSHGTAVKLYLPRFYGETSDRTTARKKLDREELPHAEANEVVLVVEDEERVRHVTVDALRELGYTVVQAADASQAPNAQPGTATRAASTVSCPAMARNPPPSAPRSANSGARRTLLDSVRPAPLTIASTSTSNDAARKK